MAVWRSRAASRSLNSLALATAIAAWSANACMIGATFGSNGRTSVRLRLRLPIHSSSSSNAIEAKLCRLGTISGNLESDGVADVLEVVEEDGLPCVPCPAVDGSLGDELAAHETRCSLQGFVLGLDAKDVTVAEQDRSAFGVTQCRGPHGDAVQHRAQVARMGTDQPQDVGGRGLQLE